MIVEFLGQIQKALVPLVVGGIGIALKAINVDISIDDQTIIAAGLITSVFTYLIPNLPAR